MQYKSTNHDAGIEANRWIKIKQDLAVLLIAGALILAADYFCGKI